MTKTDTNKKGNINVKFGQSITWHWWAHEWVFFLNNHSQYWKSFGGPWLPSPPRQCLLNWNCRLDNSGAVSILHDLVQSFHVDVLCLRETLVHSRHMEKIKTQLRFNSCFSIDVNGRSRSLALLWKDPLVVIFSTSPPTLSMYRSIKWITLLKGLLASMGSLKEKEERTPGIFFTPLQTTLLFLGVSLEISMISYQISSYQMESHYWKKDI